MRQRRRYVIVLFLLFSLFAAACGSDDDDGGTDAPPGEDEPAGEEEEAVSTEVDRSGRFSKLETFCEPAAEGEEGDAPEDVGPGITAEEIVVSHARVKLEDLAEIGFSVEVGDQTEQFQTFIDLVNERCGGIHGRTIRMDGIEAAAIAPADADAAAREYCIRIAEDQEAVFAFSASGFGSTVVSQCLAVQHDVTLVSTASATAEDFAAADGRIISAQLSPATSMREMVRYVDSQGLLEGKTIGVVHSDAAGDGQNVEAGLVRTLEELGHAVKRRDVIGCGGGSICREGVAPSVQGMIADGIDVLFPTLNVISMPTYMAELVTQGVKKGDVTFYNSNYQNQAGDLVSGKIVEFGGEPAGALYDETVVTDATPTGAFRREGFEVPEFDAMCNREYGENSASGTAYERNDADESKFGGTVTACSIIRMIARALEAAGPNPTRDDITEAMRGLGGVDLQAMVPAHIAPGKYEAPSAIYPLVFRSPCQFPTSTKSGSCITPTSNEPILIKE